MKIILVPLLLIFSNSFSQIIKEKDFFRKWKAVVDNDTVTCVFLSKEAFIISNKGKTTTFYYSLDSSDHKQIITVRPSKQRTPAVWRGLIKRKNDSEIFAQDYYDKSDTAVFAEQDDEKANFND